MALRVRFQYQTGSSLGFSIERLVDGTFWDFASTGSTAQTFTATPTQQILPIPEGSGVLLGSYNYTLTSTPSTQFTDGDFAIRIHNSNNANETIGILGAVMYNGDDEPDFPSGAGVDPLSETVPGAYASGTAGSAIGEIPTIVSDLASIQTTLATIESDVLKIPTTSGGGTGVDPLTETVPGSYAAGTAGSAIGEIPSLGNQLTAIQSSLAVLTSPVVDTSSPSLLNPSAYEFEQPINTDRSYQLTLFDTYGNLITTFQSTDVLSCILWGGWDQPVLASPSVQWINPAQGTIQLTVSAANTANLAVGTYLVRIVVNPLGTGQTLVIYQGAIKLTASPVASTIARPTYCTYSDLLKIAPWIEMLRDASRDETGFLDQCADAREWFDEAIIRNYRSNYIGVFGAHSQAIFAFAGTGPRRSELANVWLKGLLAQNYLLVSPRIVKVVALKALASICVSQIYQGGKYASLSSYYHHECESLLICTTAEIDSNGDGIGDIPINFSATNTIRT